MSERMKWVLVSLLLLGLFAVLFWIGWDAVNCMNTGGVFVEGLPWYTCVQ